ncbi:nuclear transport factor 2 [Malania oleifera]|uniref:nuclear transport factor 2 n=1 Tax=Malania oleifera TaxID=397392 RepID=UPI0025AEBED1|nr:nuclear transport factor 2 [Malania oleifera]
MASSYSGTVTAAQVGSYFVGQYYQVLQQQPDCAHQFYTDSSSMIQVDGDSSQTASTPLQIHTLILSLNFTGIEIKTINSLESWDGGILVLVSGSVKGKDFSDGRKFVQSFFLAPQEKGYFVLNDIFQFMDEEIVHQHSLPVQPENKLDSQVHAPSPIPELPVADYVLEEEARDYVNSVHIEDDTVDKYSLPDQQQLQEPETETVVEETPVEEAASLQNAVNTVQDPWAGPVEEPVGEPQKRTYASILRVSMGQPVLPVATQPLFKKSSPPASEWHHTPEPAAQPSNTVFSDVRESFGEAAEEGLALEEEGESKSVYVRNLPSNVSASEIEQEFMNFGRIKPDGVFIRSRKDIGVCYAFVEFEDLLGVQNALKASPIQLAGRQVFVEERRANSNSTSRGGRRGRGRGGYQSEATRGRFSARGSGRGSNHDGGDYSRPRGNGFYQRGSRQMS